MQVVVNMHKARNELSRLVARALAGEDVIITRDGEPVVRLVPIRRERVPGLARGKVQAGADFDAALPESALGSFESE